MINLNDYRKSKIIIKDLETIIPLISKLESSLYNYTKYTRIKELLKLIHDSKVDFKYHLKQHRDVLKGNANG